MVIPMEGLVVKAKAKEAARLNEKALNVSSDFVPKLNEIVEKLVIDACKRAKANTRNTVMAKDL